MDVKQRLAGEPAQTERIIRRKLSDQVFERLRAMIGAELKPGDTLPSERDLMERFGVGRPAVREALQSLQNKGLITIAHGERSRVNRLTTDLAAEQMNEIARLLLSLEPVHLDHLKEVRRLFESGIVRIAAQNASEADVAALRDLVEEQRGHAGNAQAFVATDMRFHSRIAAISGNPIIATVCEAMLRWLFEYHHGLLRWSGKENVTLSEHARIVDVIEVHDVDGAVAAMQAHLDRSEALYTHRA
jgi:GntR family transcriptional regulator, sialic acid-inducible nan operon repressor